MFMTTRYSPDPWKYLANAGGERIGYVDTDGWAWIAGRCVGRWSLRSGLRDGAGERLDVEVADIPLAESICGVLLVLGVAIVVFGTIALTRY